MKKGLKIFFGVIGILFFIVLIFLILNLNFNITPKIESQYYAFKINRIHVLDSDNIETCQRFPAFVLEGLGSSAISHPRTDCIKKFVLESSDPINFCNDHFHDLEKMEDTLFNDYIKNSSTKSGGYSYCLSTILEENYPNKKEMLIVEKNSERAEDIEGRYSLCKSLFGENNTHCKEDLLFQLNHFIDPDEAYIRLDKIIEDPICDNFSKDFFNESFLVKDNHFWFFNYISGSRFFNSYDFTRSLPLNTTFFEYCQDKVLLLKLYENINVKNCVNECSDEKSYFNQKTYDLKEKIRKECTNICFSKNLDMPSECSKFSKNITQEICLGLTE